MAISKRGGVFHYDFAVDGKRYRGTTKEKTSSRARMIESKLMNEAKQRKLTVHHRSVTLAEFSKRFLEWVDTTHLEPKTKKYYKSGWKMLSHTPICGMKIAHITTDEAGVLRFPHSAANSNMALRTLRRMLGKAAEWGLIAAAPRIKLLKEEERSAVFDRESEHKLLAAAPQPLRDVTMLVLDTGLRPNEVFQMRWEHLKWDPSYIHIPKGKTRRSKRFVPMSERVTKALELRRGTQTDGWVFPSSKSRCGHITSVARAFAKAKKVAGLAKEIVLYTGRHSFATDVLAATGNLKLVMDACGHSTPAMAMKYQHPILEAVRSLVDGRNERNASP